MMRRRRKPQPEPAAEEAPPEKTSYVIPYVTFAWTTTNGAVHHFIRGERVRADDPAVVEIGKAGGAAGFYPES